MEQVFSVCSVFVILHEEYLLPHMQAQRKCKPVVSLVLSFPCKDFAIFLEKKTSSSGHACSTTVPATAILSSTDQQVQNLPPPIIFSLTFFTNCYDHFNQTDCWVASNYGSADHDHVSQFGTH